MKHSVALLLFLFFFTPISAQKVREFTLEDIRGESKSFSEIKGEQLTIIDFWASWCKPCLKAIPSLDELYKKYKTQGVELIGVSTDGPRSISKVGPLVNTLDISYLILTDIDNYLISEMEISQIPTLLMVKKNGEIAYRHEGYSKGDEIEIEKKIIEFLSSQ